MKILLPQDDRECLDQMCLLPLIFDLIDPPVWTRSSKMLHHASILLFAVEILHLKLFSPEKLSSKFLLKKHCNAPVTSFSLPLSDRIIWDIIITSEMCLTNTSAITLGSLLVDKTYSQRIFGLYPSMQPCKAKPYGLRLSYPSICQR